MKDATTQHCQVDYLTTADSVLTFVRRLAVGCVCTITFAASDVRKVPEAFCVPKVFVCSSRNGTHNS